MIDKKPTKNRNPRSLANLTGKGRPKGVPNKVTADLKEMIMTALNKAGGVDYLVEQALKNPSSFIPLVGKLVPLHHTGEMKVAHRYDLDRLTDDELAAAKLIARKISIGEGDRGAGGEAPPNRVH